MSTFLKDPDAVLDYAVDWSDWLEDGETISTSAWIVPQGLTEGDGTNGAPAATNTATAAIVWLSDGTAPRTYRVINRITTSAGRTDDRTIEISVVSR